MASRRGLALVVAPLLILAACTNSATPPQPTAPPDAFAPTPTIGPSTTTRPEPTTTIDVERVVIQRVDPVSLQPVSAFEPIPMGDWFCCGRTSSDGRWLAGLAGDDAGPNKIRLVDVTGWSEVATWNEYFDSIIYVNALGTVFFTRAQGSGEVRQLAIDSGLSEPVADLRDGFSSWGDGVTEDGRFVLFGRQTANSEHFMMIVVDMETGLARAEVSEIEVPGVTTVEVDPVSQGLWAHYLQAAPSFSMDPAGGRAFVVHGEEDLVTAVDLDTGESTEHRLAGTTDLGSGVRRWSAVGGDGRYLYLATRSVELIEDDDDWSVRTSPAGVAKIDTTTWEMMARTDEPISDIYVSPDGDRLVGSGYTTEESESVYVSQSTGLFVLDTADLTVLSHYPAERPEQLWEGVTFSEGGSIGYVRTWLGGTARLSALEMATGQVLSTTESTETLEMIGRVGVLASTR